MILPRLASRFALAGLLLAGPLAPADARPRPIPPAPAIPERFIAADRYPAATVASPALADEAWWTIFGDPLLDSYVERARRSNGSIQEAAARLEKSRALLRGAAAARWPELGGSGFASRQSGPLINEAGGGGTLLNSALSLSYEVDILGKLSKAKRAARLDAEASADLLRHARLLVEADTVQAYFEICAIDEERAVLADTAEGRRAALGMIEGREANGLAAGPAVSRARSELATLVSDMAELDRRRSEVANGLAFLMGEAPAELQVRGRLGTPPIVPADIPSVIIARRPDVSAGLRAVQAAEARVGAAKASWLPSLSLTGQRGFASSALQTLLGSATQNFGLGLLFSIPGLDGGRHKARVRAARADLSLASAQYGTQLLTALRDVDDQLSAVRLLGERDETLRGIADDDRRLAATLQARYANGLISQLDYVEGQRAVLEHRRSAVQVKFARYVATIALVRALGGGWGAAPRAAARAD
ncbi:MAG: efflux transporter outer membrane subunit [Alphaproteobacteria bacterium]|nr:efflux transporter outer membrane subunit [Alphaproteobacteria bacterium]MBV9371333.1 efflux transporter outer membrane subunit [Alphaproteobacteria bacterium]MBV9901797.1 efflux transporter outer membrane subunit [Alphaproteobacteria bacterium]